MPLNIGGNTINSEIVNKYPNTKISKAGLVYKTNIYQYGKQKIYNF